MSAGSDGVVEALARRMEEALAGPPRFFAELVALAEEGQYRDVLRAWGLVRERGRLERDEDGRYLIAVAAPAAGDRR